MEPITITMDRKERFFRDENGKVKVEISVNGKKYELPTNARSVEEAVLNPFEVIRTAILLALS